MVTVRVQEKYSCQIGHPVLNVAVLYALGKGLSHQGNYQSLSKQLKVLELTISAQHHRVSLLASLVLLSSCNHTSHSARKHSKTSRKQDSSLVLHYNKEEELSKHQDLPSILAPHHATDLLPYPGCKDEKEWNRGKEE